MDLLWTFKAALVSLGVACLLTLAATAIILKCKQHKNKHPGEDQTIIIIRLRTSVGFHLLFDVLRHLKDQIVSRDTGHV